MKKRKPVNTKKRAQLAVVVGVIIIVVVIFFSYNLDQANLTGQRFGNDLAQIQNVLKNETFDYNEKVNLYEKGNLTKQEILQISDKHIAELNDVLSRYDSLKTPEAFTASLQLFRLSTQAQIDSDKLFKEWIETGDNSTKTKSNDLLQRSFEYEMNALDSFNKAKSGSQ